MTRKIFIILTFILMNVVLYAQVSFTALPPRNVIEGNKFTLTFRLKNGETNNIEAPQIDGCTFIYGPSTSTMHSMEIINGATTSSSATDYSFVYRADKSGTYKVPPLTVVVDGKKVESSEVTFSVLPKDQKQQNNSNIVTNEISNDDIFVRIILSKNNAYEQEAIDCTIKLYTKHQIHSFATTQQPAFNDFIIEDINIQSSLNNMEHYNGQNYMTAILKKCVLFPQKAGKLTIDAGKYDITIVQYERVNMGFFSQQRPIERQVVVKSNSPSIVISPLPQPQPKGFMGAVGAYSVDVKLNSTELKTNEVASLIYTIKGVGNIKSVLDPVIDFPSEFEQYSPKTDVSTKINNGNVSGIKTIEYTFSPNNVGEYTINTNEFVFFDINNKSYKTIKTPVFKINVSKGAIQQITTNTTIDQKDIIAKNTDILHIKLGNSDLELTHSYIVNSVLYWFIYVLLLIVLICSIVIYKKHISSMADEQGRRLSNANRVALKRLKQAKIYMNEHENDKFYEELLKALWGYLSDKLMIPVSALSKENISIEMSNYGASNDNIDMFITIIDDCEMARYSPVKSDDQVESLYNQAINAIKQYENVKKKK